MPSKAIIRQWSGCHVTQHQYETHHTHETDSPHHLKYIYQMQTVIRHKLQLLIETCVHVDYRNIHCIEWSK